MENQDSFNRRLRAELTLQGRKVKWLADQLNMAPETASNKLSGKARWSIPEMYMLKDKLYL